MALHSLQVSSFFGPFNPYHLTNIPRALARSELFCAVFLYVLGRPYCIATGNTDA
jgi:hypothetical protein